MGALRTKGDAVKWFDCILVNGSTTKGGVAHAVSTQYYVRT